MSVIKVGDEVVCIKDCPHWAIGDKGVVTAIRSCGDYLRFNYHPMGFGISCFELVKPNYPNPPHKHAELIKAWADGAEIECKQTSSSENWSYIHNPDFRSNEYRIKPTKSDKDVQIEKLEQQARDLADEISKLKVDS